MIGIDVSKIDLASMRPLDRAWFEASMASPSPALTAEGMRQNALFVAYTEARSRHAFWRTSETRVAYESALLAAILGGLDVADDEAI